MRRSDIIRQHARWIARPFEGDTTQADAPEVLFTREELLSLPDAERIPVFDLHEVVIAQLNVREAPSLMARRIGLLSRGARVQIARDTQRAADGYVWGEIYRNDVARGWIALDFTRRVRKGGNGKRKKIGLHFAGGNFTSGVKEALQALHDAGRPLALASVVGNVATCKTIRRLSPETAILFRPYLFSDDQNPFTLNPERRMTGAEWLSLFNLRDVTADWLSFANEWYPYATRYGDEAYAQFYIELMEACAQTGIKCTFGDFAVGHVEPEALPALRPMFVRGAQLDMPLRYHSYSPPHDDENILRDSRFYALRFVEWHTDVPYKVLIGEAGKYHAPRYRTPALTIRMMADLERAIRTNDRVIGAAWWTLNTTDDWRADDCAAAINEIRAFLLE